MTEQIETGHLPEPGHSSGKGGKEKVPIKSFKSHLTCNVH